VGRACSIVGEDVHHARGSILPRVARAVALTGLIGSLVGSGLRAQDTTAVQLEVAVAPATNDPIVFTRNLLENTPWLAALRGGLYVRLQYRLDVWRTRQGWLDVPVRQVEWTVVVRHEPLLDQFTVTRIEPRSIQTRQYATPGALAAALGVHYQLAVAPTAPGRYYYGASLNVATLSESDLDQFERALRGEIDPRDADGGSLADRLRRLVLRLAGLPALSLSATSARFDVGGP